MSTKDTQSQFDQGRAEAFAGTLLTALNHGALCLMVSVGHRTGLFDAMSKLPPATSEEIAIQTGLNERYVREWLGAMTTAGVVEVDPSTLRFSLPPEHAAFFTRVAAADNIAVFAQYIKLETHILPLIPSLTDRFSEGIRMLGVGCGRGAHPKQARDTLSQEPIRRNGSLAGRDHVCARRRLESGSRQHRVHRGRSE